MEVVAKSYAIDFQTESVLALNKKLKVNWKFLFRSESQLHIIWVLKIN